MRLLGRAPADLDVPHDDALARDARNLDVHHISPEPRAPLKVVVLGSLRLLPSLPAIRRDLELLDREVAVEHLHAEPVPRRALLVLQLDRARHAARHELPVDAHPAGRLVGQLREGALEQVELVLGAAGALVDDHGLDGLAVGPAHVDARAAVGRALPVGARQRRATDAGREDVAAEGTRPALHVAAVEGRCAGHVVAVVLSRGEVGRGERAGGGGAEEECCERGGGGGGDGDVHGVTDCAWYFW